MEVPFLGRIPIYEPICRGGDAGQPLVIGEPESAAARAFFSAAEQLAAQVSIASFATPIIPVQEVQ
jgi:ATP-binding protein involved in chromosome partitioning